MAQHAATQQVTKLALNQFGMVWFHPKSVDAIQIPEPKTVKELDSAGHGHDLPGFRHNLR